MRKTDLSFMFSVYLACLTPRPTQKPSQWCVENLSFDEAGNHGPFRLDGCEYLIDVIDDWANTTVNDIVLVFGSQTRKTGSLMGGACWAIVNDPCGFLWVMPSLTLARKFSTQRWKKMIMASAAVRLLAPTGARRHEVSALSMMLGASTINLVGSNSAANLSSNPCRRVVLDEVDKFDAGGREEADAVNLAEQRTKDQTNPQRWKTSTPTLTSGLIWQEFLKGNQMRYFVPCPKCGKHVVFAWSKQFTVFPLAGNEAFIRWAPEAKRTDGTWDYEKVKATTRAICPHCNHGIEDSEKKAMVKAGEWRATNPNAARNFISRHLPSLYVTSTETTFGSLAVKFLQSKRSLLGLQGFINGDLAEPYAMQDVSVNRRQKAIQQIEVTGEWLKILSVDYHHNEPYFWAVVRAWNGSDKSHGVCYKSFNQWYEVDELQAAHKIIPSAVIIDEGFQASTVRQNCADFNIPSRCVLSDPFQDQKPECVGWSPAKSQGSKRLWQDKETGLYAPIKRRLDVDPFYGTDLAGRYRIEVIDWLNDIFEDILENVREGKTGLDWTISSEMDTDVYHRHMSGTKRVWNKDRSAYKWQGLGSDFPDHIKACERLSLVLAYRLNLISFTALQTKEEKPPNELATIQPCAA